MVDTALNRALNLQERTKGFALRVIRMYRMLPKTDEARIIGKQVLRSGTSIGANYRAACRARSKSEFSAKMSIVVEEMDETIFWLELLVGAEIVPQTKMRNITDEANQLLAIFAASQKTIRKNIINK
ncbi:MAG: four helix bundle protein [Candidatus Sumerlaeota bacterium]|nr:four helix bundle protein [Candidatus Sumerlaeota bacterium]